jgi:CheY-like chemotaxis protein
MDMVNDFCATVWLVDADPLACAFIQHYLSSAFRKVKAYASQQDFLHAFQPSYPACLLLETHLPDGSGLDLQIKLQAQQVFIPTLFISQQVDVSLTVKDMKQGAFHVFEKSLTETLLLPIVLQALHLPLPSCLTVNPRDDLLMPVKQSVHGEITVSHTSKANSVVLPDAHKTEEGYPPPIKIRRKLNRSPKSSKQCQNYQTRPGPMAH